MLSSPFYPITGAKKQTNTVMNENETSIMPIPRRFRKKSPVEIDRRDKEVQIVDTGSTEKQA